jgi:hypothetical protein
VTYLHFEESAKPMPHMHEVAVGRHPRVKEAANTVLYSYVRPAGKHDNAKHLCTCFPLAGHFKHMLTDA